MLGGPINISKKPKYIYKNYNENNFPSFTIGTFFRETGNNFIAGFTMPYIDSSASKYFVQVETELNLQPGTIIKITNISSSGDAYYCEIPDFSEIQQGFTLDGYAIIVYGIESKNPSFNFGLFTQSNVKRYLAVKISKDVKYYLFGAPIFIGSKGILMPADVSISEFDASNVKYIYIKSINEAQTVLFAQPQDDLINVGDIIGFNGFYNAFVVKFN